MSKKKAVAIRGNRIKNEPIYFNVVKIELVEKYILADFDPKNGDNITVRLSVNLSANNEKTNLIVNIRCAFVLDNQSVIFSMVVQNEYHIPNLKNYIVNNKFSDRGFIEYIADLSLSHTRGVQSTLIKGTPLDKLYIPVLQLDGIANETIK